MAAGLRQGTYIFEVIRIAQLIQTASHESGLPISVLSDEQFLIIHDLGELLTREHYIHIDISCQFH
jgi:hypothetical protein